MTPQDAADQLDGRQYGNELTDEFRATLKREGLVAVFGASDDLMEFRGAINNEIGCYGGGEAFVTRQGLLENDCDSDNCPHFAKLRATSTKIIAKWDDGGFSFRYETEIPHAKFVIKEDGDNYCEGIVFALADVALR